MWRKSLAALCVALRWSRFLSQEPHKNIRHFVGKLSVSSAVEDLNTEPPEYEAEALIARSDIAILHLYDLFKKCGMVRPPAIPSRQSLTPSTCGSGYDSCRSKELFQLILTVVYRLIYNTCQKLSLVPDNGSNWLGEEWHCEVEIR